MKRDMDLVRRLLLAAEALDDDLFTADDLCGAEASPEAIEAHILMLHSGGYLESRQTSVYRLSWAGHEFLDTVRDPEIWRKTKEGAANVGSSSITLLAELAAGFLKAKAASLGLPMM